jgi:hypothetical protein
MMKRPLTALVFLAALFGESQADAGPWVGSTWISHNRSASQCVDAAQKILANFGYKITFSTESVTFGETDERTILVNCQIPHYAVFEVSATKAPTDTDSELATLKSNLSQALATVSSPHIQKLHLRHIQKIAPPPATPPLSSAPTP